MKVIQINAIYGALSTGVIMADIQQRSLDDGIEAHVAYSIPGVPAERIINSYHIGNQIDEKVHAILSRIFGRQAYFSSLPTQRFLHHLDNIRPDIVHLHNLHNNYINLNMLLRYLATHDIATVITLHDCWYFTGGCMHFTSIDCQRWQTGCGDCPVWKNIPSWFHDTTASVFKDRSKYLNAIPRLTMVGASEWVANETRKSVLKNKSICHIHNGFDLSVFRPVPSDKRDKLGINNRFVILGPANKWLLPINRPALECFLERMTSDMVLVLFGAAIPSDELPQQVIQLGYMKSRQEMAELYSMADVFVNCSREDTLSSLNLECQACGTPVVTYDATGSKETVDENCGFAVSTGDAEALWKKVCEVKQMGKQSLTASCREWIATNFEKNENYKKYIRLYHQIMER